MKKYIRCHIVEAEPMTRGEHLKSKGLALIPGSGSESDEGYFIQYPDGYKSWCPKAQFEAAGNPIDNMTFGQAIDACRYRGAKIQRKNWNGEGQYVVYQDCATLFPLTEEQKKEASPEPILEATSSCFVFHFVNRKTGETGIQVGWLASQADMYASDWRIVE